LPAWAKVLWYVAEYTGYQLLARTTYADEIQGLPLAPGTTPPTEWRRFSIKCEDTVSADTANDAYVSIDIVNYTNGVVDTTWTTADYGSVVSSIEPILAAWATNMSVGHSFTEISAYRMAYHDPGYVDPKTGKYPCFVNSGPPDFTTPVTHVGVGTALQAAQVSATTTEITGARAGWGRTYWPFPASTVLASGGGIANATVDAFLQVVHDKYGELMANQFPVVVPSCFSGKTINRALQTVSAVRMDNVPDIQRRRRLNKATYSKTLPLS